MSKTTQGADASATPDADTSATQTPPTAEQSAATASALDTISRGVTVATREDAAAAEAAARADKIEIKRAENKKLHIYTNPVIEILHDCKVAGHTVYAGDKIGINAGISPSDHDKLRDLGMAKDL